MNRRAILAAAATALMLPAAASAVLDLDVRPMFVPPTAPEIVDVTPDENTMVATQGIGVGVWDITNPESPVSKGFAPPPDDAGTDDDVANVSSVAVISNRYALAAAQVGELNRDYLWVIDLQTTPPSVVREMPIADWPDSIAVSPDKQYAAVAIENECEGLAPLAGNLCTNKQGGPTATGSVEVVDISASNPATWSTTNVPVPADPDIADNTDVQPEFVDISPQNKAAVTFQENNGVGILDLATRAWDDIWSAGTATFAADNTADATPQLVFSATMTENRDPDAVKWFANGTRLITANEGEAANADNVDVTPIGGTRGYTIWTPSGTVVADTANTYDKQLADFGFVSDNRSNAKGIEPEGLEVATFDGTEYAFVNNERGFSFGMVNLADPAAPVFQAVGPTGEEPEGIVALPTKRYVITANEVGGQFSINKVVERATLSTERVLLKGTNTPFFNVTGAGAGPSGSVLFTDQNKPNFIRQATLGAAGYAPFTNPVTVDVALAAATLHDVAQAPGGGYWAAVQGFGTVDLVRLNADGSLASSHTLTSAPTATGVAVSADGATVYVSSSASSTVTRFTVASSAEATFTVTPSASPASARIQDLDITAGGDLVAVEAVTPGSADSTKSQSNILRIAGPAAIAGGGTVAAETLSTVAVTDERSNRAYTGLARLSGGALWTTGGQRPGRNGNTDLRRVASIAPANTAVPEITGTARAGSELTCGTGTWSAASSYIYAWYRAGVAIPGATSARYTATDADAGKAITCSVTGTNAEGTTTATSAAVTIAARAASGGASGAGGQSATALRRSSATCLKQARITRCTLVTRDPGAAIKVYRGSRLVRSVTSDSAGNAVFGVSRVGVRGPLRITVGGRGLYALVRKAA